MLVLRLEFERTKCKEKFILQRLKLNIEMLLFKSYSESTKYFVIKV